MYFYKLKPKKLVVENTYSWYIYYMEIWQDFDQKIVIDNWTLNFQVFIRELISNASDAIEKFRYLNMTGETLEQGRGYSLYSLTVKGSYNRAKVCLICSVISLGQIYLFSNSLVILSFFYVFSSGNTNNCFFGGMLDLDGRLLVIDW